MEEVEFFVINVEQTNWQTSQNALRQIRHKVFVEEQQVPQELDVDGLDPSATHWLAFNAKGQPVGTARLTADGHLGRLAVLKPYRNLGVGSAIMRQIIRFAAQQGIGTLALDAQVHAVPFYQGLGFAVSGKEYREAGIPHVAMNLDIGHLAHPVPERELPDISEKQREHKAIDGLEVFLARARKMAQRAELKIRIFSDDLNPVIFSDQQLCQAFFELASRHPTAEIRVLVRDNQLMKTRTIGLAELSQRLSSHIFVKQLNKRLKVLLTDFLVFDDTGILCRQELKRYVGYSVDYAPREALELIGEFDLLWEQSEPDPEARRLHI